MDKKARFYWKLVICLAVLLSFINLTIPAGQWYAEAANFHPLQDKYDELKLNYGLINKLLATNKDTGLTDKLLKAWVADVENELDDQIINQKVDLSNLNTLQDIVVSTFDLTISPLAAKKHKEVFNALIAVYGKEIKECIFNGADLPADIKHFLDRVKTILISYIVVADPPPGEYTGGLEVTLKSFTEGSVIKYTTDGSDPTYFGTMYQSPLELDDQDSPVSLKAIAVKNNVKSELVEFNYIILPPPPAPQAKSFIPAKNAQGIAINTEVSVAFDLDIVDNDLSGINIKGGGKTLNGTSASVSGKVLKIEHPDFEYGKYYTVTIPAGAVKSKAYNTLNELTYWSFKTIQDTQPPSGPAAPVLEKPANWSTVDSLTPSFSWQAVSGEGVTYALQIATSPSFGGSTLVVDASGLTGATYTSPKLAPQQYYYWRVSADSDMGATPWSSAWRFRTPSGPAAPVLEKPANWSTVDSLTPSFSWQAVSGEGVTYALQIATSPSFGGSTLVVDASGLTGATYTSPKLAPQQYYYWRVSADSDMGATPWSTAWRFRTPVNNGNV